MRETCGFRLWKPGTKPKNKTNHSTSYPDFLISHSKSLLPCIIPQTDTSLPVCLSLFLFFSSSKPTPPPLPVPPPRSIIALPLPPKHSFPIIPPLPPKTPELDQPPGADGVPGPQQGGAVDVERRVDLRVGQQGPDGAHRLEDRVGRGPGGLEQVEADLARLERDVGVHHGRGEAHLRRGEGVVGRDLDGEEPPAFCVRGGKQMCVLVFDVLVSSLLFFFFMLSVRGTAFSSREMGCWVMMRNPPPHVTVKFYICPQIQGLGLYIGIGTMVPVVGWRGKGRRVVTEEKGR